MLVLACALGFLFWCDRDRMRRVEAVSALADSATIDNAGDAASPTGYPRSARKLIVPERNESSFHTIAQTQQMFARGEWRVRQVDYDNAPFGREVSSGSLYRWWLGALAWADHAFSGRALGLSVERAALYADPIAHGLLLIGCTVLVAARWGGFAASCVAVALVTMFPFAAGFLPGAPDQAGATTACALLSILVVLIGLQRRGRAFAWMAIAGFFGGAGIWLDGAIEVPILTGIVLGALVAAWRMSKNPTDDSLGVAWPRAWRIWAGSGAATVLAAYLFDFFPSHLDGWRLDTVHPIYGVAWWGSGEWLAWIYTGVPRKKRPRTRRDLGVLILAAAAVLALPVAMAWSDRPGLFAMKLSSVRLTSHPVGISAANFWSWLTRDGLSASVWATVLPLLIVLPAGWRFFRRSENAVTRLSLAVAFGPVLIGLGFAFKQLSWWGVLDAALLALLVAAAAPSDAGGPRLKRGWMTGFMLGLMAIPGVVQVWPRTPAAAELILTSLEGQELIERHLAHWLAQHTTEEGAVIYAPPHQTLTLSFYGGFRGVGTFSPDNPAGFGASLALASVSTMEEAQALLQSREVRYIVVPSWDPFFDEFGRLYLAKQFSNRANFFVGELRHLNLPLWLRPISYQLPPIGGFEGQSVLIFEVVDEQSPALAFGRLAEYLVESGEGGRADATAEALRRFPGDIGALSARAQVQTAGGDAAGAAQTLNALLARLSSGADRFLPWDRRVSLAIVLAQGQRVELAREQVRRCLTELNEKRLRSLSTGSLYSFLVLSQALGLPVSDLKLRALALDLLPGDLRKGL